jgi:hypothetical protein
MGREGAREKGMRISAKAREDCRSPRYRWRKEEEEEEWEWEWEGEPRRKLHFVVIFEIDFLKDNFL